MKKKLYEAPWMNIIFVHTNELLTGSVMKPGLDNDPPGTRGFDDYDDWDDEEDEESSYSGYSYRGRRSRW